MSKLINYSSSEDDSDIEQQQRKHKMETKNDKLNASDYDKTLVVSGSVSSACNNNLSKHDSRDYSRESRDDYRDDHKDKKYSKESSSHKSYNKDRDRVKSRDDRNKDRKQKSNYERRSDDRSREYSSRDKHRNEDRSRRTDYRESSNRNRSDRRYNERIDKAHQQRSHEKLHRNDYYSKESRRRSKSREAVIEQKLEQQQSSQNTVFPGKSTLLEMPAKISRECPHLSANSAFPLVPEPKEIKAPEIQLPSYYNPNVINPNKFAEQVQKRKLIWGNKKNEDNPTVVNKWAQIGTAFTDDGDGKTASKFMRLMGIKNNPKQDVAAEVKPNPETSTIDNVKKREEMFSSMEKQYEVARQVTHTMRGVGFGFSTQRPF